VVRGHLHLLLAVRVVLDLLPAMLPLEVLEVCLLRLRLRLVALAVLEPVLLRVGLVVPAVLLHLAGLDVPFSLPLPLNLLGEVPLVPEGLGLPLVVSLPVPAPDLLPLPAHRGLQTMAQGVVVVDGSNKQVAGIDR